MPSMPAIPRGQEDTPLPTYRVRSVQTASSVTLAELVLSPDQISSVTPKLSQGAGLGSCGELVENGLGSAMYTAGG